MRKLQKLKITGKLVGAASFLLLAHPVAAGPDDVSKWLIKDPVSMMDLGLLRIEQQLISPSSQAQPGGIVEFSWDKNRISISRFFHQTDDSYGEEICAKWISEVRDVALIVDGKPMWTEASSFAYKFTHEGFERTNTPKNLPAEIDKIIELKCGTFLPSKTIWVTAALLGTSYAVETQEKKSP